MKQVLQPCRVATVTTMVHITALDPMVTGGVLPSTQLLLPPGTGSCTTVSPVFTDTTTISLVVTQCVVFGINKLFDNFPILTNLFYLPRTDQRELMSDSE